MDTVDWSEWGSMSESEQQALRRIYLETIKMERDRNFQKWNAMSPSERARYPEITQ